MLRRQRFVVGIRQPIHHRPHVEAFLYGVAGGAAHLPAALGISQQAQHPVGQLLDIFAGDQIPVGPSAKASVFPLTPIITQGSP